MIVVKNLKSGVCIYKKENLLVGGYDYYSNNVCGGYKIVDAYTHIDELKVVIDDLEKIEKEK